MSGLIRRACDKNRPVTIPLKVRYDPIILLWICVWQLSAYPPLGRSSANLIHEQLAILHFNACMRAHELTGVWTQLPPLVWEHSALVLPQDKQRTRQRDLPHVLEQVLLVLSNVYLLERCADAFFKEKDGNADGWWGVGGFKTVANIHVHLQKCCVTFGFTLFLCMHRWIHNVQVLRFHTCTHEYTTHGYFVSMHA